MPFMQKRKKGRKVALVAGLALVVLSVVVVWIYWTEIPFLGLRYRPIAPRDNSATHRLAKPVLKACHVTSRQRIHRRIFAAGEGAWRRRRRGPEELVAEIGYGIREFDLAVVVKIKHVQTGLHFAAD